MNQHRFSLLCAVTVLPLALTACADNATTNAPSSSSESAATAKPLPVKYVALGDSYASMATRDVIDPSSPFCLRSVDNYAAQLAELLGTEVTDVSCQGGVVADITNPRSTPEGQLPPQIDAVPADTTLITVTIGGNDIGFGDLVRCASTPSECSPQLVEQTNSKLDALPPKLEQMYAALKQKAPEARIITTGYLPLIAEGDNCEFLSPLPADVRASFLRATAAINDTAKQAAEAAGATFVLPGDANAHTACAPTTERWTDFTGAETAAYPMHPTASGQAAMAEALLPIAQSEHSVP